MCIDAVDVVDREAGREYGFNSYKEKPGHAGQLHLQPSKDDLADLSTNNLDGEHHFPAFGSKATVAKFCNKSLLQRIPEMTWSNFSPKHFKILQVKTSILLPNCRVTWKRYGLTHKSSFKCQKV